MFQHFTPPVLDYKPAPILAKLGQATHLLVGELSHLSKGMRQLFVDSRDRISGTSCDFTIQLPETLVIEGNTHKGRIDNLRVPVCIPTIQTGVNDTIIVRVENVSYTFTAKLPQANYDGPDLASAVKASLVATGAPGTWTVVYDSSNIAMSITSSQAFSIIGGTFAAQLMSRAYTQTSNSYNFTYVPVQGIDMMYLSSQNFATLDTIGPSGAHDTLMCAVVSQPYGSVLDAGMPIDAWFNIPPMTTQQLSFQLRDRSYNVLTIVPNISFVVLID